MNFREDGEFGEGATIHSKPRPPRIKEAALATVVMLVTFAALMTVGYWARHDRAVWDDICWVECYDQAQAR